MAFTEHVRFIVFVVAGLVSAPLHVAAQDIFVTRMDDPAPNGCLPSDCSLREAVIAANVDPVGYNDIRLTAGTYQVNATPVEVTGGTRIHGAGNTQTMVRGDGTADLITFSGPHQLDLANLAIDGQGQRELFAVNGNRVGIYRVRAPNPQGVIEVRAPSEGSGDFSVGESEISAQIRSVDKSALDVFDSRIALLTVYGTGFLGINFTSVGMSNVTVDGGLAAGSTSGMWIDSSGLVEMTRVTVQDTSSGVDVGGHALLSGELDIDRLHYSGNARPVVVTHMQGEFGRSVFLDNINDDLDAALPGALLMGDRANVTITGSTFAGNRAGSSAGGAILIRGIEPTLTVFNSTFSNNLVSVAAASQPGGARGGAIGWNADASEFALILRHVTVSAPSLLPFGHNGSAIGGFGTTADGNVRIYNSIVRGNCSFAAGSVDFGVGNIESGGNTCGFPSDINQVNVSSTSLALGPLGENGGYTATIVPGAASVARDSATALFCLDDDQRGHPRPFGAGCDVGAVEVSDAIFINGFD